METWNYEDHGWPAENEWIVAGFLTATPLSEMLAEKETEDGPRPYTHRTHIICRRTNERTAGENGYGGYIFETPKGLRFYYASTPGSPSHLGKAWFVKVLDA